MIFVGGLPFENKSTHVEGVSDLEALVEHPVIVSAALSFKAIPEKKLSSSEASADGVTRGKHVYVFQREYATVDPALVDLIGTDEATTCVGVVIRNPDNGMISVAHMDSPKIVDGGLSQMLSNLVDHKLDAELDVHLIGGFEDTQPTPNGHSTTSGAAKKPNGHSVPLCAKIIDALGKSSVKFHIQTFFVLRHNTRRDSDGNLLPIFNGILVETSTGTVIPASFDDTTRCPDGVVRRVRLTASFDDPFWSGRLLETYDTETDRFIIAPCSWNGQLIHMASVLKQYPDLDILHMCSTSPAAEAPDFVDTQRRQWDYLIQNPNWKETFRMGKPRVLKRNVSAGWTLEEHAPSRKF